MDKLNRSVSIFLYYGNKYIKNKMKEAKKKEEKRKKKKSSN